MERVLVTGGAGYIGAHTASMLLDAGARVVVLDALFAGQRWAVPANAAFVEGDIADRALVKKIIRDHRVDAVLHFAAHVSVPESVSAPEKYYRNNVLGSFNLIQECIAGGVGAFIFSSSAAVYGAPVNSSALIKETDITAPINPYGAGKLMTEWMLRDCTSSGEMSSVALRYFNVAGARADGSRGQATANATHLIKVACQAACGLRDEVQLYGDDYPTADGTCIRDYIHVDDLARAHLDALQYLSRGGISTVMNCGYGRGYSVAEVIACVKKVSGVDFTVTRAARRAGDPPALVADNARIRQQLNWQPRYDDLPTICRTAWEWERALMRRDE